MFSAKHKTVVAAAAGINLVIGVLYAWSIFKEAIVTSIQAGGVNAFQWDITSINDPYALCCLVFAIVMVPAGRLQDTLGPKKVALMGGLLGAAGFLLIASSVNYWVWMIGFGGLVGAGIGFAYASTTPAALKWFAPNKSGLVTGVVVSGFALASVYVAPLASYLVTGSGLNKTMLFFALQFFLLISLFSFFLHTPPYGYVPPGFEERRAARNDRKRDAMSHLDEDVLSPLHVLRESRFWVLWMLMFIGAGAGLMVIGNLKPLAKLSMGELAYLAIVILAVGDATGRILTGTLSTRFGRRNVLSAAFLLQTVLMFAAFSLSKSVHSFWIMSAATLIGMSYGANLVLFPNYVKDFWGMRHFGAIYGMLFTAWGIGGFVLIKVSEKISVSTGSSYQSFMLAGGLMLLAFVLTFKVDNRKELERIAMRNLVKKDALKLQQRVETQQVV
ncbi:MAG TPA: OFA family MFS transporter [Methylotenera sp.]|nr:OFA family MFS transporter [Methylotenera sp.]HPH04931.1 OFA family MFS transporter [Methylotenera sp.]HPN01745.1 OFA family MFS transporter [Methylotenera sp.]